MAVGTGIAGQLGFAAESVYGTPVTVTKFLEVDTVRLTKKPNWQRSNGIRSGQLLARSEDAAIGTFDIDGRLVCDLTAKNMALLLKHLVGSCVTAGAGPYTHTITPGDKTGLGLTMQGGIPDVGGTVRPFTASGIKVVGGEIAWERDKFLKASFDLLGKDLVTATALASASYSSANPPYGWPDVSVTIGGSAFKTQRGTLRYSQPHGTRFYGGATTTDEPLQTGDAVATLDLLGHLESLTAYDRIIAGTEAAVVVTISKSPNSIVVTGNARFLDGQPELAGKEYVDQPYKCEFTATGADSTGFSCVVTSPESAP